MSYASRKFTESLQFLKFAQSLFIGALQGHVPQIGEQGMLAVPFHLHNSELHLSRTQVGAPNCDLGRFSFNDGTAERHVKKIAPASAENPGRCGIGIEHGSVGIDEQYSVSRVLHEQTKRGGREAKVAVAVIDLQAFACRSGGREIVRHIE